MHFNKDQVQNVTSIRNSPAMDVVAPFKGTKFKYFLTPPSPLCLEQYLATSVNFVMPGQIFGCSREQLFLFLTVSYFWHLVAHPAIDCTIAPMECSQATENNVVVWFPQTCNLSLLYVEVGDRSSTVVIGRSLVRTQLVSEFFIDLKSFRSHYGPGVESASNRNE